MRRQNTPPVQRALSVFILFTLLTGFLPPFSSSRAVAQTPSPPSQPEAKVVVTQVTVDGSRVYYELENQGSVAVRGVGVLCEAAVNGQNVSTGWTGIGISDYVLPPAATVVDSSIFVDAQGNAVSVPSGAAVRCTARGTPTSRPAPPLQVRIVRVSFDLSSLGGSFVEPRVEVRNTAAAAVESVRAYYGIYDRQTGRLVGVQSGYVGGGNRLAPGETASDSYPVILSPPFDEVPVEQWDAVKARLEARVYVLAEYVRGGLGVRILHPALRQEDLSPKAEVDIRDTIGGSKLTRFQLDTYELERKREDPAFYVVNLFDERLVVPPATYEVTVTVSWYDPARKERQTAQETRQVTVKPDEIAIVTFFGGAAITPTPIPEARCEPSQVQALKDQAEAWGEVRPALWQVQKQVDELIVKIDDVRAAWAPLAARVNQPDPIAALRVLQSDLARANASEEVKKEIGRRISAYLAALPSEAQEDMAQYLLNVDEGVTKLQRVADRALPDVQYSPDGLKRLADTVDKEWDDVDLLLLGAIGKVREQLAKMPAAPQPITAPAEARTDAAPTTTFGGEGLSGYTPAQWLVEEYQEAQQSGLLKGPFPFTFGNLSVRVQAPVSDEVRDWLQVLIERLGQSPDAAFPDLRGEDRRRVLQLARDMQAVIPTWDLRTAYNAAVLDLSPQAYPPLVRRAPKVIQALTRLRQRYRDLRQALEQARTVADREYMAAYKPFAECVTNATEGDIKAAVQAVRANYAQRAEAIEKELDALDQDLDQWWIDLASLYEDTADKAGKYGVFFLDVFSKAMGETPLLQFLAAGAKSIEELLGIVELAKLGGKLTKGAIDAAKARFGRLNRLQEVADLAKARASAPAQARQVVKDVIAEMAKNKRLFGDEAATEKKLLKWYNSLLKMGLDEVQIKRVLKASADPEEAKRVLGLIRESIQETAKEVGPFDFKAVGTGAEVDKVVAGVGDLPNPNTWNFLKNDYDVSVFVPSNVVDDVLRNKMTREELGRYLEDLGLPPDLELNAIPPDLQAHIARKKIMDTIVKKFTAKNGGIPPDAYDNMWFHGFATRGTRQEHLIDAMNLLRAQPPQVTRQLRQAFGEDPARAIRRMLREGRGEEAIARLKDLDFADRDRLIASLARASKAPDMQDVLAGRVPVWRVTNVLEDDAFITRGGKKLVEIMAEGAPSPAFRATGEGITRTPETANYLRPDFRFTPGDGVDILAEMGAFFHFYKNKGKGADKVAKYYLRAAFGRLATDPDLAPILQREYLKLATYRGNPLPPEARMVFLAETLGRERGLFTPEEIARLKQALYLKYPNNPVLPKVFPGVEQSPAKEMLSAMANDLSAWYRTAQANYRRLLDSGQITQAADDMHRLGQRATLGRLDSRTLQQWFGLSPQEATRISRIKYDNPTLTSLPDKRLLRLLGDKALEELTEWGKSPWALSVLPATAGFLRWLSGAAPPDPRAITTADAARLSPADLERLAVEGARTAGVAGERAFGEEAISALDQIATPRGNLTGYYASLGAENPLSRFGAMLMDIVMNPLSFLPRIAKSLYEGLTKNEAELWQFMYRAESLNADLNAFLTIKPQGFSSRLDAIQGRLKRTKDGAMSLDYEAATLLMKIDERLATLKSKPDLSLEDRARVDFLEQARQEVSALLEQRVRPQKAGLLERVDELQRRGARAGQAETALFGSQIAANRWADALAKVHKEVRVRLKYADYSGVAAYAPTYVRVIALLRAWALARQAAVMRASDVDQLHDKLNALIR